MLKTVTTVIIILFIICNSAFAQVKLSDYELKHSNNKTVTMNEKTLRELLETINKLDSEKNNNPDLKKDDYCCACTGMTPASVSVIKAYGEAHAAAKCYINCCYQDICSYGLSKGQCR